MTATEINRFTSYGSVRAHTHNFLGEKGNTMNSFDKFVTLQGRMYTDGLHIQGKGSVANRGYGVAVTLSCPDALHEWVGQQPRTLKSFVSNELYLAMQGAVNEAGIIVIQAKGTELNRAYGASFEVNPNDCSQASDLAKFITNELAKVTVPDTCIKLA